MSLTETINGTKFKTNHRCLNVESKTRMETILV